MKESTESFLFFVILIIIPFIALHGLNNWVDRCDKRNWDGGIEIVHSFIPIKYFQIEIRCNYNNDTKSVVQVIRALTFHKVKK